MTYIVNIKPSCDDEYSATSTFTFNDSDDAIEFAEIATKHIDDPMQSVSIDIQEE